MYQCLEQRRWRTEKGRIDRCSVLVLQHTVENVTGAIEILWGGSRQLRYAQRPNQGLNDSSVGRHELVGVFVETEGVGQTMFLQRTI